MTDALSWVAGAAMPEGFRVMMRGFPTGVAVVTAADLAGQPWGMTCTSICSVTLNPPTLLVSMQYDSATLEAIQAGGLFTVNLLHADARDTAELFASGTRNRLDHVRWHRPFGSGGPHLPQDALAVTDCRLIRCDRVGDHEVVYGNPCRLMWFPGLVPLLYGQQQFRSWPSR